jgi:hypothetical protein
MSRRRKNIVPPLSCPQCGQPIVVLPMGRRYVRVDPVPIRVFVLGSAESAYALTGYARHACAGAKPKARRRKAVAVPMGEDQGGGLALPGVGG